MSEIVVYSESNVAGSFSERHEMKLSKPLAFGWAEQSRKK